MATTDPVSLEPALKPLAMDAAASVANTEGHAKKVKVTLDRDATQALLQTVPVAYNTQINDVLLTALARAWGKWTASDILYTNLEGHGQRTFLTMWIFRERPDGSRRFFPCVWNYRMRRRIGSPARR